MRLRETKSFARSFEPFPCTPLIKSFRAIFTSPAVSGVSKKDAKVWSKRMSRNKWQMIFSKNENTFIIVPVFVDRKYANESFF